MNSTRIEAMDGRPIAVCPVEIVERKGIGHPDTICDMISEHLSVTLSRHYLERFGLILHHNVDKALLNAGRSEPAFGGGIVSEPIDIYLSGRATINVGSERLPIDELAHESVRSWLCNTLHALDPDKHVRVHCLVRPGSPELVDLFVRQHEQGVILANDTSCGVGFAPFTSLEQIVLELERYLNSPEVKRVLPASGQDIKIMGIREADKISLTISNALIGRYLDSSRAYMEAKEQLATLARDQVFAVAGCSASIDINVADDVDRGAVFLTVTGTSAESGDDGETGRGNRANGLITPLRPMTLEAVAGKNPVSHVGKLYNVAAHLLAQALVDDIEEVQEAECYLVSQIGSAIDSPRTKLVRVRTEDAAIGPDTARAIEDITSRHVARISSIWNAMIAGQYRVA